MNDRSFWISLIGFLLIVEGISWWLGTIIPFTDLLKLQVALLGPGLHSWLFSERSLDVIHLLFFRNPVVFFFGGLAFMVTGAGLIMLKPWARMLLIAEAAGICALATVCLFLGGWFGAGGLAFWGVILFYALRPKTRELFRLGWQDFPQQDDRSR